MIHLDSYEVGSRLVTLVNSHDQVLGDLDILEAHRHPPQRHRAVSVWLFREGATGQIEVLLQKRSASKPIGAEWWGNAICANVKPDESYEACAHRRLREELGLEGVKFESVYTFEYRAFGNDAFGEHELDRVFAGWSRSEQRPNNPEVSPNPNPDEVSEVRWVDWRGLLNENRSVIDSFLSAQASLELQETHLLKEKTAAPKLVLYSSGDSNNSLHEFVVPWSVMMLKDSRLIEWVERSSAA